MSKKFKSLLVTIAILLAAAGTYYDLPSLIIQNTDTDPSYEQSEDILKSAFESKQSNIQVRGFGDVVKLLPDDNKGSRHQRFILSLQSGQTILVAHNIDLANRISGLQIGDRVEFYGVYEWNARGGVIHWTHHDPNGSHIDGWLKHKDRIYQ